MLQFARYHGLTSLPLIFTSDFLPLLIVSMLFHLLNRDYTNTRVLLFLQNKLAVKIKIEYTKVESKEPVPHSHLFKSWPCQLSTLQTLKNRLLCFLLPVFEFQRSKSSKTLHFKGRC